MKMKKYILALLLVGCASVHAHFYEGLITDVIMPALYNIKLARMKADFKARPIASVLSFVTFGIPIGYIMLKPHIDAAKASGDAGLALGEKVDKLRNPQHSKEHKPVGCEQLYVELEKKDATQLIK